ncbi:MAG: SPOR domain-containing protein, partial [Neisseriaceae bacterium]|nr:SPOR domain-containing protein [Neisseriaceae bacterium]
ELIEIQKQARRRLIYAIVLVICVMLSSLYFLGEETASTTEASNSANLEASGAIELEMNNSLASIEVGVAGIPSNNPIASTEIIATIPYSSTRPPPVMSGESRPYTSLDNAVTGAQVHEVEIDAHTDQIPKIQIPKKTPTKTESSKLDPLAILNGATTPAPSTKSSLNVSSYTINLGAFANPDSIANIKKKNESMQLPIKYTSIVKDGSTLTRVRIGPFDSSLQAQAAQKTLSQAGLGEGLLVINK